MAATLATACAALHFGWAQRMLPGPSTGSGQAKAGYAAPVDEEGGAGMLIWVKRG